MGVTQRGHGRDTERTGRGCEEHGGGTWRGHGLNVEWIYRGRGDGGDMKGKDMEVAQMGHGWDVEGMGR